MVRSDGENVTELLIRCRAHDDAAFSELVELYTPMINKNIAYIKAQLPVIHCLMTKNKPDIF